MIGEAAKRVPDEFRAQHTTVPWRLLAAFRDVLIHDYESVNLDRIWTIITDELPGLEKAIQDMLPPLDELEIEIAGESGSEDL